MVSGFVKNSPRLQFDKIGRTFCGWGIQPHCSCLITFDRRDLEGYCGSPAKPGLQNQLVESPARKIGSGSPDGGANLPSCYRSADRSIDKVSPGVLPA